MKNVFKIFVLLFAINLSAQIPQGFSPIFNGTDLSGWNKKGDDVAIWKIENNTLSCEQTVSGRGWIEYFKAQTDFEFYCEWKAAQSANSGIFIHVPSVPNDPTWDAIEIQICDDNNYPVFYKKDGYVDGDVRELSCAIYGIVGTSKKLYKGVDQWNTFLVSVVGDSVKVVFNGEVALHIARKDYPNTFYMWGQTRKSLTQRPTKGFVGIQAHKGAKTTFRNIALKELASTRINGTYTNQKLHLTYNRVQKQLIVNSWERTRKTEFFNVRGESLLVSNEKNIDISQLPNGFYLAHLQFNDGNFAVQKILVIN